MYRLAALLLALSLPSAGAASVAADLRSGYSLPWGGITAGLAVSDLARGQVPLDLTLRWRFSDRLSAGAYVAYAFGVLSGNRSSRCDALGADCSLSELTLGLEAGFEPGEVRGLRPYLAARVGWESMRFEEDAGASWVDTRYYGWDLGAEGGLTLFDRGPFRVGAFLGASAGSFYRYGARGPGLDESASIADRRAHGWVTIGLRATVAP